jgi:hypothetical protein
MTVARTRRNSAKHRRSPEEIADDFYDAMPTTLYDREGRTSGVLRAAPRDFRGASPSPARANAPTLSAIPSRTSKPSPLATFSLPGARSRPSPSREQEPRISQMLRELPVLPAGDGSRPLICVPNPFLTPPAPTAPPPMWSMTKSPRAKKLPRGRPRSRRSIMPFVAAAVAIAIGMGLWHDDDARSEVSADLARTADRVGAFVVEAAIR